MALEINQVSSKQSQHALNSIGEVSVCLERHEVGLTENGQLGLETKELAFCGAVELPLFGSGVTSIAVGDGARGGQCGQHELIGRDFGLPPGVLAGGSDDVGSEGDRLLPHL